MTIGGIDINEFGKTEKEAREKLAKRIADSEFLMDNLKLKESPGTNRGS